MKKLFYTTVLISLLGFQVFGNVKAYLNYAVFYAPGKGTYVETYMSVAGPSVIFKKIKAGYQGKIHVEITFQQGGKIIAANSYNLLSPLTLDSNNKPNFIDLQRYPLKPGTYQTEIKISDANDAQENPLTTLNLVIPAQSDSISISDIELAESFKKSTTTTSISKSGYDIVPYPFTSFAEHATKLVFYVEGYNTLKNLTPNSKFLFNYYVESAEGNVTLHGLSTFSTQIPKEVNSLIGQFDISKIPSGTYNLVVEIRDSQNKIKAQKKIKFTRIAPANVKIDLANLATIDTTNGFVNKVTNPDTLRDYISCLWPISTTSERDWQNNQIKSNNVKIMQQYIYAFWLNRNPSNPQLEWEAYRQEVLKVNKMYRCGSMPGYMTDRGRVRLQYGEPSAAQKVNYEPDSYPYEIWQYYRIKDATTGQFQSNKKFVFYNPILDDRCYTLLHSDARGETRDDRWQIKLKQRDNQIMNLDQNAPTNSSYGDGANDLFNNPR